jgi:hypothetical protein
MYRGNEQSDEDWESIREAHERRATETGPIARLNTKYFA